MRILFLSDIDGTLVQGHTIPERVRQAVRTFTNRGNYFALATGRNAFAIRWLTDRLNVNAPCILLTGAALFNPVSNTLTNVKRLPEETKRILARLYAEFPDMGIQVFTRSGLKNLRLNPFLAAHGIPEERELGESPVDSLEGEEILKIGLCCEDYPQLQKAADGLFGDGTLYKWHYSFEIGIEIFSPSASKGIAMEDLIAGLPERPGLIAAAGDSPNDLPMFTSADETFAPTNAFTEVQNRAKHLIAPPKEGGVADALDTLMELYN